MKKVITMVVYDGDRVLDVVRGQRGRTGRIPPFMLVLISTYIAGGYRVSIEEGSETQKGE